MGGSGKLWNATSVSGGFDIPTHLQIWHPFGHGLILSELCVCFFLGGGEEGKHLNIIAL